MLEFNNKFNTSSEPLNLWATATDLEPSDFDGQALKRPGTLAVLFQASWCGFCRRFQPVFEEAAKKSGISWSAADVSDDDNVLWDVFNIAVVPTVIVFRNGKPVFRSDGVRGRGLSQNAIDEIIHQMKS